MNEELFPVPSLDALEESARYDALHEQLVRAAIEAGVLANRAAEVYRTDTALYELARLWHDRAAQYERALRDVVQAFDRGGSMRPSTDRARAILPNYPMRRRQRGARP